MEEQKKLEDPTKFPNCRGTFDNCPTKEEINSLPENKQAPSVCGKCPVFQEKPPKGITVTKERLMTPENEEFYNKVMGGRIKNVRKKTEDDDTES